MKMGAGAGFVECRPFKSGNPAAKIVLVRGFASPGHPGFALIFLEGFCYFVKFF
jgi:hypothetical protein